MNRELWLLRHGKAEHNGDIADFDRCLTAKGERDVKRMGLWLKQEGLCPDILISSPAKRALGTAGIIADTLGLKKPSLQQDGRLYFQGIVGLKKVLADIPVSPGRVLLVGHNPDLEDLLAYLVGMGHLPGSAGPMMPTAALVRLHMPADWSHLPANCAQLLAMTHASSLS
ncbi:MAG: histidine phosphatase family protein [Methylovulum miyakonense]|uniref:SixA phosphatase family protein n=1 Tax=Methylovulum miyakonense TaxID=645578 RepID=UPI003BB6C5C1